MSHDQLAIVAVNADAAAKRDAHRGGNSYEASMLRNLLALIHRDGGHYLERHGMDKALEDAEAKIAAWLQRDDMTPNFVFGRQFCALTSVACAITPVHG